MCAALLSHYCLELLLDTFLSLRLLLIRLVAPAYAFVHLSPHAMGMPHKDHQCPLDSQLHLHPYIPLTNIPNPVFLISRWTGMLDSCEQSDWADSSAFLAWPVMVAGSASRVLFSYFFSLQPPSSLEAPGHREDESAALSYCCPAHLLLIYAGL